MQLHTWRAMYSQLVQMMKSCLSVAHTVPDRIPFSAGNVAEDTTVELLISRECKHALGCAHTHTCVALKLVLQGWSRLLHGSHPCYVLRFKQNRPRLFGVAVLPCLA